MNALEPVDAVYAAERELRLALRAVDDMHELATSALWVLGDADLDAAKSHLTDRTDYYLEAADGHLRRLQTRCADLDSLVPELRQHLGRAGEALRVASSMAENLASSPNPQLSATAAELRPRIAVLTELVDLARPVVDQVASRTESAFEASRQVTRVELLEARTLEHTLRVAGREMARADEDINVLASVVTRADRTAHQAADTAAELIEPLTRSADRKSVV